MTGPTGSQGRAIWAYTPALPLRSAPFLHWPLRAGAVARHLARSWLPLRSRFFLLTSAVIIGAWLTPSPDQTFDFSWSWFGLLWLRNLVLVTVVAGGLHVWFYVVEGQGAELRYDSRLGRRDRRIFLFGDQVRDNVFLTLVPGVLVWTLTEYAVLAAYARGHLPTVELADNPVWFVAFLLLIPMWSILWFSIGHRLLHVGPAYRHVHSWHHRNVSIGPWSGLAMHPVEHLVLFSDVVILLVAPSHPVHLMFLLLHHGLGAPMSHTGYDAVLLGRRGGRRVRFDVGDFHHQLHHRFIECNYGGTESPLDELIGSFHDGTPAGDEAIAARRRGLSTARRTRAGG